MKNKHLNTRRITGVILPYCHYAGEFNKQNEAANTRVCEDYLLKISALSFTNLFIN